MYQLEYLPTAKRDMVEIVRYISHNLSNPAAAKRLSQKMLRSVERLSYFPYIGIIYDSDCPLKHAYRILPLDNYLMFFWIDEEKKKDIISRVIYGRRDYEKFLE